MNSALLAAVLFIGLVLFMISRFAIRKGDQATQSKNIGQVDFKTLKAKTPSSFLALPEGFGSGVAADHLSPVFTGNGERTREAFRQLVANHGHFERIHVNDAALRERYLLRGGLLKLPCILQVEFINLGAGRSSIAICSTPLMRFPVFNFALSNPGRSAVKSMLKELEARQASKNQANQDKSSPGAPSPKALANG